MYKKTHIYPPRNRQFAQWTAKSRTERLAERERDCDEEGRGMTCLRQRCRLDLHRQREWGKPGPAGYLGSLFPLLAARSGGRPHPLREIK